MSLKTSALLDEVDSGLRQDVRWQLVERVLASGDFQRAGQLRRILMYISRHAIIQPDGQHISEYEIACDVLGRRQNFDPASDNIVRVQISNLRRRLEKYFSREGANEGLVLRIPKGAYLPVFEAAASKTEPAPRAHLADLDPLHETYVAVADSDGVGRSWKLLRNGTLQTAWSRREKVLLSISASLVVIAVAIAAVALHPRNLPFITAAPKPETSIFLEPLLKNGAGVSIVLPDTSLLVIDTVMNREMNVSEYMKSFPDDELNDISDPKLRDAFKVLGSKRSTTFGETNIAEDLAQNLSASGMHPTLRYARDMHVGDLGDENDIILGSSKTNPWQQLFSDQINFRYFQADATHKDDYFKNIHPRYGQPSQYTMETSGKGQVVNYADVTMTPNLTNSGYVLLITGEDVQGTEAAARFLLNGQISGDIRSVLEHAKISSFELFLRGTHIRDEENSHIEVVDFRYKTKN